MRPLIGGGDMKPFFDDGLRRCTKCLLPETHETIEFDESGVCNICRQIEFKQTRIDWNTKRKDLFELVGQYRDKYDYDCIVPFSGGKDSTFTLYYIVQALRLKPLVIRFDHGFLRPTVLKNTERSIKKLGVDFIHFRPNWKVVQKLMLESLKRKGDFCWHCHTGIFSYPMQMAVKLNVPLIIWGEPSAEYTSYYSYEDDEEVDERRFNRSTNLGITAEDMVGMLDGTVTLRDLKPYTYPDVKDLRRVKVRSVCLGSYIPWDVKRQVEVIKKELGWQEEKVEGVPDGYGYEKIECGMQGVRDYLKFAKRGYARATHLASIDIRNGRLTREEGMGMVLENEGKRPASLEVFLEHVGLNEDEFNKIALSHAIAPYKPDMAKIRKDRGEKLWDQDQWDRTK
jgi:N-acetyl sugar amidotransferase